MLEDLPGVLRGERLRPHHREQREEAIALLGTQTFDLVVTDLNLPGVDGLTVMSHAKSVDPELEVIVLTGNASTLTAIDALRQGAYDYVLKPFDLYDMERTVQKGLERRRLLSENRQFVSSLQQHRDELSRRVEEATRRMRTLYEVGKEITSNLNLDRTLNLILEKSVELTRARRGMIFLVDEMTGILECDVVRGFDGTESRDEIIAALEPINEKVCGGNEPVLEPISGSAGDLVGWVVPLIQESEVMGTIAVLSHPGSGFSEDDQNILVNLASQAAIAIHNARVYGKMQALDRMKSDFVAVVSHEVRTPLTAIKGTLEILSDRNYFEIPESQVELFDICRTNVDRLETLINDILDFSKLESSKLSTNFALCDLGSVVETVVVHLGNLAEKKALRIERDIAPDLPKVLADDLRISQVVGNLLSNAVKFSDPEGEIRVDVKRSGAGVEVGVRDQGMGIVPEDQVKLFTKFRQLDQSSTRKVGGTGLGLAICKGIIEEHHGRIWVESAPGKGSRFVFWVPCTPAESAGPATEETPSAGRSPEDASKS
ncbi:MAG: ATP-binding protein [Candidatus Eisenbacteria bacterium]